LRILTAEKEQIRDYPNYRAEYEKEIREAATALVQVFKLDD